MTTIPAGWKLVPIEPTEPMHVAAVRTIRNCTGNDDFPPRVYAAMLAAAPAAPADGWLPIESAPKDGTHILAWREDCGQFIASYTSADGFPLTQAELDAYDEDTLFQKDWFTQWPDATRLDGSEVPTKWQRLPADPGAAPAAGDALADPALQKLFGDAITGALGFGAQGVNPPPVGHWLEPFWNMARADAALAAGLALLDHPLLRDVLGYVEDAGPADVWGAAQSWMGLRDAAIAAQSGGKDGDH
ncbi:hypothetical protein [Achromobacter sp. DH1f]|uniref:hypothetical protein n=1 Tax=Achromobacter sp. DH1f TaxID=1397275 RepID=UPI00046A61B0|nr:hypothetical protein [Achromobacter sp. DH1f]